MKKLSQISDGVYETNSRKNLNPIKLNEDDVLRCTEFAYDMTFGKVGEHKKCMNGSTHKRTDSEIFACTFQGKLGEFGIYNYLKSLNLDVSEPDLRIFGLGKWDNCDLTINNENISVKSSPSYLHLLKLNYCDYNSDGSYKFANSDKYRYDDYIMYTRVLPNANQIVKANRDALEEMVYRDTITANAVEKIMLEDTWKVDLPGYITLGEFRDEVIHVGLLVKRGEIVDGLTMFNDFYYTQTGDLNDMATMRKEYLEDELTSQAIDEVLLELQEENIGEDEIEL